MNGAELTIQIMKLTEEVERSPRWALAYALAFRAITTEVCLGGHETPEQAVAYARDKVIETVREATKTARVVNRTRGANRLLKSLDEAPKYGRRKKRR